MLGGLLRHPIISNNEMIQSYQKCYKIIKGFDDAGISEAITCANDVFTPLENHFDEQRQQHFSNISSFFTDEIFYSSSIQ